MDYCQCEKPINHNGRCIICRELIAPDPTHLKWVTDKVEHVDSTGNVNPDFEDDDDLEEEPIGYHCIGCGNIQDTPGECNRCTGYSLEEIYE